MLWNRKSSDNEKHDGHTAVEGDHRMAPVPSTMSLQPVNTLGVPLNSDDALLEKLGYKAELKRDFSPLELFGLFHAYLFL